MNPVSWRLGDDNRIRTDLLVGISDTGLALLTERPNAPEYGEKITVRKGLRCNRWLQPAVVTRIDHLSGFLDLVAAEYIAPAPSRESSSSTPMKQDRRVADRGKADRRRSARWGTSKPLRWRVFRGRRIREGLLVERSLDGLVLVTRPKDAPRPGTRFVPGDAEVARRFGFRSALVKRTEAPDPNARLVFVEIEA